LAPFEIGGDESIILETVKYGEEDGIVLRFYEALGSTSTIFVNADNKKIIECNIIEDEQNILGEGYTSLTFKPFEIKTIKLK
jgi:alpha-mannosidase